MMKIADFYFGHEHNHAKCIPKIWWGNFLNLADNDKFCLKGQNGQFCGSFWFKSASWEKLWISTNFFQNQQHYSIWYGMFMFWIWSQTDLFLKSYEFSFWKVSSREPSTEKWKKTWFSKEHFIVHLQFWRRIVLKFTERNTELI